MDEDDGRHGSLGARAQEMLEKASTKNTGATLRETSVKTTKLLENLKDLLSSITGMDRAAVYCDSIDQVQSHAQLPRLVIGVYGISGAGKSTLINAVLDEENIVPTHCATSCTSAPIEVSWNSSDDPEKKYRAEVQFISQIDWRKELEQLHGDIIDDNGQVRDASDESSQTAFSILRSVYPNFNNEELASASPDTLANHTSLQGILGSKVLIEEKEPVTFYERLKSYVDSPDTKDKSIVYWPIVKVVRVFLKSKILSTGVVLVDLPGSHDSNSVRAAVAERFMKECTGLWIVASICRAVTDKTAKTLLGQQFRQQMKVDGSMSNITFICTKTDDINNEEAARVFDFKDKYTKMHSRLINLKPEIQAKEKRITELRAKDRILFADIRVNKTEAGTWRSLKKSVKNNERVFAPYESPKKRQRSATEGPRKKPKTQVEPSDTEDDSSSDSDAAVPSEADVQREPLTIAVVESKISQLSLVKTSLKAEKAQSESELEELQVAIENLEAEKTSLDNNLSRMCIRARNKFSRKGIRRDFAFGLRELDEELDEEELDETLAADSAKTDYEKLGRALPVYCVSSQGYQQIRKNEDFAGLSLEDTEVPALQRHTLDFAATVHDSYFKAHLNEVCRLIRGIDLFLAGEDVFLKMSDAEREKEYKNMEQGLNKLTKEVDDHVAICMDNCEKEATAVFEALPRAASKSSNLAMEKVQGWNAPSKSGGFTFNTYKAICRRHGVFKGINGSFDLNEDLFSPMRPDIAKSWVRTFNKELPKLIDGLASKCTESIAMFHGRMRRRNFLTTNTAAVQSTLDKCVAALNENQLHVAKQHKKFVKEEQREVYRSFYPAIQDSMGVVYNECSGLIGRGALAKIQEKVKTEIEAKQQTMFIDAAKQADDAVHKILEGLDAMVHQDLDHTIKTIKQDYTGLIGTITTEVDKVERRLLAPVMDGFYQELIMVLGELDNNDGDMNMSDNTRKGNADNEDDDDARDGS